MIVVLVQFMILLFSPAFPSGGGGQREHTHSLGLRQKQSNQPVLGYFLSNFIIQHLVASPVAWNLAYASGFGIGICKLNLIIF